MNLEKLKKQVDKLKQKYTDARKLQKVEKEIYKEMQVQLNHIIQAQEIAQEAAGGIQQQIDKQISYIVNKCLQAIFSKPYEFQIHFTPKRGKTEARLVLIRDNREIKRVGGGVIVIVAFALRLASILLSNKTIAKIMMLDQAFSGDVSKDGGFLERVPDMITMLCKEFGFQFIQVTHSDELKMGKIIKVK